MSSELWEIEITLPDQKIPVHIYESRCNTLVEVEEWALFHCKVKLTSDLVSLKYHGGLIYLVCEGSVPVGTVKINSIPEKPKCQTHHKP